MRKWWYQRILMIIVLLVFVMGTGFGMDQIQAKEEEQLVSNQYAESNMLIPGGAAIGIYMETEGILVLDTDEIECIDGKKYEPAKNIVKSGDYIVGINGKKVEKKSELVQVVNKLESEQVVLRLRRDGEVINVKMKCVEVDNEKYKLGIWVKDNIQGLGTLTYLKANGEFGALGHGIHDTDTEELIEISDGSVYEVNLVGVQKGKRGTPGGLEGVIIYNRYNKIGKIDDNTENGITGKIEKVEKFSTEQEALPMGRKEEIKIGKATILCTVNNKVEEYEIKIKNTDTYTSNVNKGIIIEITDEKLLKLTGGIVQGMSGSPIIQDGKIVGAVTHVLVNDPTRGSGIFIENMLSAEE